MALKHLEAWMERQESSLSTLCEQQTRLCHQLDEWMEENSAVRCIREKPVFGSEQSAVTGAGHSIAIIAPPKCGIAPPKFAHDAWSEPEQPVVKHAVNPSIQPPQAGLHRLQPPSRNFSSSQVARDSSGPQRTESGIPQRGASSKQLEKQAKRLSTVIQRSRTSRTSLGRSSITGQRDWDQESFDHTESEEPTGWQRYKSFIGSNVFESIFSIFVMANFLWIGIQMEFQEYIGQRIGLGIDMTFCIAFLLELLLRLVGSASLCDFFCSEKDWAWNWFDVIIVFLTTFEIVISTLDSETKALDGVSGLRVVRVMRVLRVVRVIRGLRHFRPLRLLISAITSTIRSAIWTLILLMLIIYTFSVMFAQSTRDHLDQLDQDAQKTDVEQAEYAKMSKHFGTLGKTLYTLFSASTGGCDWQDVAEPLGEVSWVCLACFIVYISFQYFCVMNVVTGIFCQSALEIAKNDREDMIAQQLQDKDRYVTALQDLFRQWDAKGDGELSLEEFQHHMKDTRMQAFLRSLEIEPSNAFTLFKLLDADGQGTLDVSEFVSGLIELRGNAKSIQIHELLHETSLARDNLQRMFDYLVAVEEDKLKEKEAAAWQADCRQQAGNFVTPELYDPTSGTCSTTDSVLGTPGSGASGGTPPSSTHPHVTATNQRVHFSQQQQVIAGASCSTTYGGGDMPHMPSPPMNDVCARPPRDPPHVVAIDEV